MAEPLILQGYPRRALADARPYSARQEVRQSKPGTWRSATIRIFKGEEEIGSYERNYGAFGAQTFEPFERNGRWYALYSPDYTGTRVMTLPDCRDIGGEDRAARGFCPVELYVPRYRIMHRPRPDGSVSESWGFEAGAENARDAVGPWHCLDTAFVAGCIWGDDSSWKLQALDLSRVEEGIIRRDERFGYFAIADGFPLAAALRFEKFESNPLRVYIARQETRDVATGKRIHHYTDELEG
jgi:hypothetical protein